MYQGNWKCSGCGGAITELPFQPRSEAGLNCRACFMKNKGGPRPSQNTPDETGNLATEAPDIPDFAEIANEPAPGDDFGGSAIPLSGKKPRFSGSWQCATCGGEITSLPFQPRDTSNLKCLDCFKRSKN
jgi:CxxC-x17-CxxC domain-containing protein